MTQKKIILTQDDIDIKLHRLAFEVAETMSNTSDLIVLGIKENGLHIAKKLIPLLQPLLVNEINLVGLSLNKQLPNEIVIEQEIDFNNKNILLVDDVCNSGKTLLYALKPLLHQHPAKIEILVLVDRMYKQFPVKPNFIGLSVATTLEDFIEVTVDENNVLEAILVSK